MVAHKVVAHDEWAAARKKHLAKEKEFTHLRDQLSRERRELPWELVNKDYTFEGENGPLSLHEYEVAWDVRAAEKAGRKHDQSLQALAVRENTVYVAQRPQLPEARVLLYLDVEGLPDRDRLVRVSVPYNRGDLVARAHAAGEVTRTVRSPPRRAVPWR